MIWKWTNSARKVLQFCSLGPVHAVLAKNRWKCLVLFDLRMTQVDSLVILTDSSQTGLSRDHDHFLLQKSFYRVRIMHVAGLKSSHMLVISAGLKHRWGRPWPKDSHCVGPPTDKFCVITFLSNNTKLSCWRFFKVWNLSQLNAAPRQDVIIFPNPLFFMTYWIVNMGSQPHGWNCHGHRCTSRQLFGGAKDILHKFARKSLCSKLSPYKFLQLLVRNIIISSTMSPYTRK